MGHRGSHYPVGTSISRSEDRNDKRSRYDDDYSEGYEIAYEDHRKRHNEGENRCSICKFAVFFIFLGLTFGLVFGLVDLDKINSLINDVNFGGNSTITNDDDVSTISNPEEYEFMQCQENSECCNGLTSNCDLTPNEILFATVHNAMHDDKVLANNQAPLEEALEAGYRGLMLDACLCPDPLTGSFILQFCHAICEIGKRDANEVFGNIKTFLDNNPTEVVFINFEISSGSPTPDLIWEYVVAAGLRRKTYLHDVNFPTMRDLLLDGRQLILSKHGGFGCTDPTVEGCTGRIFEFHSEVVESDYDFYDVDEIENSSDSCPGTRGLDGTKSFYAINNFVTALLGPSKAAADIVNQKEFLEVRLADCEKVTGYKANFIHVDFWQRGDLLRVTQETNVARAQQKQSWVSSFMHWIHN